MTTFSKLYSSLRQKNKKQYFLLSGCCFFSVLLITAYVCMMRSPTVLTILPEGGDSRKQVMMIFVLAVFGCGVFTTYAGSLFLRYKSKEVGIFLALGAKKKQIATLLCQELGIMTLVSCFVGALLGTPLSYLIWSLFRLFLVDSEDMLLRFDPNSYVLTLLFCIFVFFSMLFMLLRFMKRTNIMDVIYEAHNAEPMQKVPSWYGYVGIVLLIAGALLGYMVPSFCVLVLNWYAPEFLTAIFYLPVFIGLYMILIHTVMNGWRKVKKEHQYKNIIITSMMKFQGKQTVRNMIIIAVLIAGAYFASFYAPMLTIGSASSTQSLEADYAFHYRNDQALPDEYKIRQLANSHSVQIKDYVSVPFATLGSDGLESVYTETAMGATYIEEYRTLLNSEPCLSESSYTTLTGEEIDIPSGTISAIFDKDGYSQGMTNNETTLLTNPITKETLSVTPNETVLKNTVLFGYKVLDDRDYQKITQGLTDKWLETQVFFNVADVYNTYDFANSLFNLIVDSSSEEVEVFDAWDGIQKMLSEEQGIPYKWDDPESVGYEQINYSERDSSIFHMYWKYMPQFRVLNKVDFVKNAAVFLMLFIFIAIICFSAVIVIVYTRCITIAINNAKVYKDLKQLGSSNTYLYQIAKAQLTKVFFIPILTGTSLISAFYIMILFFNDSRISAEECFCLLTCLLLIVCISSLFYVIYRITLKKVCSILGICI